MPLISLPDLLRENTYPGRGIAAGKTPDGRSARIIYFIMGRSANSRNRIFDYTPDGIRTEACDASKMEDPSLIIYHPVRFFKGRAIVTNGDQTDTIRDSLEQGYDMRHAVMQRTFEPDGPNWTPRISAIVEANGNFEMSIIKSGGGNPRCTARFCFDYNDPIPGVGHFLSTYMRDGSPLPSFEGEPTPISIEGGFDENAEAVWAALNSDNRVSLYACDIDIATGEKRQRIINRFER